MGHFGGTESGSGGVEGWYKGMTSSTRHTGFTYALLTSVFLDTVLSARLRCQMVRGVIVQSNGEIITATYKTNSGIVNGAYILTRIFPSCLSAL